MNVGQLREAMAFLPDEMSVILQKDAEGNDFSPLEGSELGWYVAETTWSGEVVDEHEDGAQLVVVLFPVN